MDLFLQAWGGGFYLLNKVTFALAEGRRPDQKRTLKLLGWSVYLGGVPAWVIILVGKHDWIAAAIEAGGVPAMMFGFFNVYRNVTAPDRRLDRAVALLTYACLLLGVTVSLHDYGGLTSASQLLEIGVMIGFLTGSYLLAKNNACGWLFFLLMNASMAALMLLQDKPLLAIQQIVSLCFGLYGFTMARQSARTRDFKG